MQQQAALIDLSNAIREKYMQIKLNDVNRSEILQKRLRPIVEPLSELVSQNKAKLLEQTIKNEATPPSTPDVKPNYHTNSYTTPKRDYKAPSASRVDFLKDGAGDVFEMDAEQQTPKERFAEFIAEPENLNQTLEHF